LKLTKEQKAELRTACERAEGPGACEYAKGNGKPMCVIGQLLHARGVKVARLYGNVYDIIGKEPADGFESDSDWESRLQCSFALADMPPRLLKRLQEAWDQYHYEDIKTVDLATARQKLLKIVDAA
jgi:hypothetical protein